jgi:hypothetical protein
MRAIVKGFVVGTLGLAVLFGSPAVSLAQPKLAPRHAECQCRCSYAGAKRNELGVATFPASPNSTICVWDPLNLPVQSCKDNAGKVHQVAGLLDCKVVPIYAPIDPAQRAQ